MKKNSFIKFFILLFFLFIFMGCSLEKKTNKNNVSQYNRKDKILKRKKVHKKLLKFNKPKKHHVKNFNFTFSELKEIEKDGYLSYYYRRKYSPDEIKMVWNSVITLFPDYSRKEKLLATRAILSYHWVVYRTTINHNFLNNIKVTKKYEGLIDKYSGLHGIPSSMIKGIITWENSGGEGKRSWASCVGVGQLSWGAVETAHGFYKSYTDKVRKFSVFYENGAQEFDFPLFNIFAFENKMESLRWDIQKKHNKLRIESGYRDERLVPQCNIEDAVIYLKLLYNNYNQRQDLAISAYHNGGLNNNDILRDYINRHSKKFLGKNAYQRDIIEAIDSMGIKFIDIWKDVRSRDMLNGSRTVYGDITNSYNRRLSLGDESDIYLWKVAAAYGASLAPLENIKEVINKYKGPWDVAECRDLPLYNSYSKIKKAIKKNWLVPLPKVYKDVGIASFKGADSFYYKERGIYNYYVLPETAGLLLYISKKYRQNTRNPNIKIPLRAALDSRILELYSSNNIREAYRTHIQGVSIDIDLSKASHSSILKNIIKQLYLHDKIYWVRKNGANRITVNPRYGKGFYKIFKN